MKVGDRVKVVAGRYIGARGTVEVLGVSFVSVRLDSGAYVSLQTEEMCILDVAVIEGKMEVIYDNDRLPIDLHVGGYSLVSNLCRYDGDEVRIIIECKRGETV